MENKKSLTLEDLKGKSAEWLLDKVNQLRKEGIISHFYGLLEEYRYKELPCTYDECCEYITLTQLERPIASGFMSIEIEAFQQLLVCREAYLDFNEKSLPQTQIVTRSFIENYDGELVVRELQIGQKIPLLCFPAELCERFFGNFKEIIEQCKAFI